MRRRSLLALPALLLAAPARAQDPRPLVVASFSILGDMVRQIGGDVARLHTVAGPNVDAHSFTPRPSDAEALRNPALVVRNGFGFDSWLDRMLRSGSYRGPVITASEGIVPRMMGGHNHDHGGAGRRRPHAVGPAEVPDPHCWQDLRYGIRYVRNIGAALAAALPGDASALQAGTAAYASRLQALDAWVRSEFEKVPEARRKFVTSHDAFGYFSAAYGVTVLAPQGVSTESEPSAGDVARLIRQIRAENISAVFIENMTNPATLQRLAREAGVTVRGRLFSDALSEPGGPAATYEAMFRNNIGLMVPAMLGGVS